MVKRIILFTILCFFVLNFICTSYALSPPYISSVQIADEDLIEMKVGDTLTLEATAITHGVNYAYLAWGTDIDGIVAIRAYDEKVSPPTGTVTITALNAGVVEIIVGANLESYAPEYDVELWADVTDRIKITVFEDTIFPKKYEIWNNGEYSGISSLLTYYNPDNLYINVKDISKLGLLVEDIKGGIIVSNDIKKVKVMYDAEVLELDSYKFETPVISLSDEHFLMLDIIGKCFSDTYRGTRVDDVWRIYLEVNSVSATKLPSIEVQSTVFNFDYGFYTIQLKNNSNYEADSVNIYTAYYSKNGTLLDTTISNIYTMKAKDELVTFIPISHFIKTAAKCKIMIWNDEMQSIGKVVSIKNLVYDKTITVPDNKEIIFADVPTDYKYYDAIYVMSQQFDIGSFNGYEGGTYRPYAYMLKSEFAYSLTKMLGMQVQGINVDCNLKDVPASHWCKNAIGFLVSNKIMEADNKYFYPNDEITLDEVLTALVKVLGESEVSGDTVMTLADQYNLLTNVATEELKITRGNFTQIAYNFMNEYCK